MVSFVRSSNHIRCKHNIYDFTSLNDDINMTHVIVEIHENFNTLGSYSVRQTLSTQYRTITPPWKCDRRTRNRRRVIHVSR